MRMENNKLPVKAYKQRRSGYKAKGRPRVRWVHNLKEILKKHQYSTAMATHLAFERKLKLKPLRFTASVDQFQNPTPATRQ
jgi:competence CoiA-like predicted nuclease